MGGGGGWPSCCGQQSNYLSVTFRSFVVRHLLSTSWIVWIFKSFILFYLGGGGSEHIAHCILLWAVDQTLYHWTCMRVWLRDTIGRPVFGQKGLEVKKIYFCGHPLLINRPSSSSSIRVSATWPRSDTRRMAAKMLAMVTGSTSGIGLVIARVLAATGNDIVLNGLGSPQVGVWYME